MSEININRVCARNNNIHASLKMSKALSQIISAFSTIFVKYDNARL